MACVFCDRSPVTNEHVFPRWLDRYLTSGERQQLEQTRYGQGGFDTTRASRGLDFRVKKVCAACNNGWMSQLERDSMGALDSLIRDTAIEEITLKRQRQIALWATKTAMMADLTQSAPILTRTQRRRMRTHGAIPGGTLVWMGSCGETYPLVTSHTVRIELEDTNQPDTVRQTRFFCSMKIGHLCLYIYFAPPGFVVRHRPEHYMCMARIWPRRASGLPFPPPIRPADGPAFEEYSDDLWESFQIFTPEEAEAYGLRNC